MKHNPFAPNGSGCAFCAIVPISLLNRHAKDRKGTAHSRKMMRDTATETERLRSLREVHRQNSVDTPAADAKAAAATKARELAFDCERRNSLPGKPADKAAVAKDPAIQSVIEITARLATFYQQVLGRNSVDNAGSDLVSSVHYLVGFNNAFWNGHQMVYGDGDGQVFDDFYRAPDVIGHELTHGLTQHESGLHYEGEAGALNESFSDVIGATFHQWINGWPSSREEGWLIGASILGKASRARGKTCLRDMLHPGARHCLSQQPESYQDLDPAANVHLNSGIANKAFALFAREIGKPTWELAALVWYQAALSPKLKADSGFRDFARLTRVAAKSLGGAALEKKVAAAWKQVDVRSA